MRFTMERCTMGSFHLTSFDMFKARVMSELTKMAELKLALHDTWTYYGQPLRDDQLLMMAEDLMGCTTRQVQWALTKWRKSPPEKGHKPRAPMPCELLALICPVQDLNEEADSLAGEIVAAIGRVGYYRPAQAEEELGLDGWQVVALRGGWASLCRTTTEDTLHVVHAQLRDVARGVIKARGPALGHEERQLANQNARRLHEGKRQPVVVADAKEGLPAS